MFKAIIPYLKLRYFLYFFALVAGWPCVFYLMGWLPFYKTNYILLFVLTGVVTLSKFTFRFVPKIITFIILLQILVWTFYSLFHIDSSYLTRVFLLIITFSILGLQLNYKNKFEFINVYNYWLAFQAIAGSIGFILVIFGLLKPISVFIEMDGRTGYFFGLFTTNAAFEGFSRNAGFYDEPGALAFWGVFALLLNKLFINNKKIEFLLLFGLISTLSMAFFIQVTIYLFLFYKKQRKKILLPLILFILVLKGLASFNEGLDSAIFGRFTVNEETGTFAGDNRSELMERCWRIFKTSPVTGVGATNLATVVSAKEGFVGANFFTNWASDGIIGVVVTYMPLLLLLIIGQRKRQYKYAVLIIFLGYLQRPYTDTQLLYPLTLYTLLLFAYLDVNNSIYQPIRK
ncbi:O-antigen ligase domain-containing protein [Flammeovirga sp. MY04]|uniref:O-antigen ligase family protein n=1 Tax=Flammeovirga sp. MY04 TaxID=1191459 RepID=UPI00080622FF|nr:O-antigen ligase family protein [Flammeovirga sp. MY04]ANQ47872.1 O-antigen ligase domain-containing protein [Flammeovirga sp. MY04]